MRVKYEVPDLTSHLPFVLRLFSPGQVLKNPFFACLSYNNFGNTDPFQKSFISLELSRHGRFLKKNGNFDICTLNQVENNPQSKRSMYYFYIKTEQNTSTFGKRDSKYVYLV